MKLTDSQLQQFHSDGYLFLPDLFDDTEVKVLRDAAQTVYALEREEVFRESDGKTARTAFAAHEYNEAFRRLGRHPRLIRPVQQILSGDVYMHQYKVNAKAAFTGDVWQWHQDFGTWSRDDLMPEARAMNIALYVDDAVEFNGPLWMIPGSHREGVFEAGHDLQTTSYPLWTLDRETITRLVDDGGIVSAHGKAGSVLMFYSTLVHCSPPNLSPWPRTVVYLSLCHVDNHIRQFKRPAWIAHRDFTPIACMSDDCLRQLSDQTAGSAA
ncbi:MAG: phytanoyl-CoA dioxygenase family protein [Acidiferrobacterales bacterium]|nr:phytanoyl-CoA dioxygenase family protein [Acidiferrobacterales bacterium]